MMFRNHPKTACLLFVVVLTLLSSFQVTRVQGSRTLNVLDPSQDQEKLALQKLERVLEGFEASNTISGSQQFQVGAGASSTDDDVVTETEKMLQQEAHRQEVQRQKMADAVTAAVTERLSHELSHTLLNTEKRLEDLERSSVSRMKQQEAVEVEGVTAGLQQHFDDMLTSKFAELTKETNQEIEKAKKSILSQLQDQLNSKLKPVMNAVEEQMQSMQQLAQHVQEGESNAERVKEEALQLKAAVESRLETYEKQASKKLQETQDREEENDGAKEESENDATDNTPVTKEAGMMRFRESLSVENTQKVESKASEKSTLEEIAQHALQFAKATEARLERLQSSKPSRLQLLLQKAKAVKVPETSDILLEKMSVLKPAAEGEVNHAQKLAEKLHFYKSNHH